MKVLLIEDSPEIITGVSLIFKLRWPEAILVTAEEGTKGIEMVKAECPDAVILDINLPDITGFQVLQQVRLFSDVPVIIVSVRGSDADRLSGLEMGADDYVTKPFSPANLVTRIKAVVQRTATRRAEEAKLPPLVLGNTTINFATREVFRDREPVLLAATEWKILSCIARSQGRTLLPETIKQEVWGSEVKSIDNDAIKRFIYQLRSKLGDSPENPQLISGERDTGYRLVTPR